MALKSELERALLAELATWWQTFNRRLFQSKLTSPVMALSDSQRTLGCWRRDTRTLSISRTLIVDASWGSVVEVLKHEMAHQYVDEVLHITDETAHGASFQRVCSERGIDGAASGQAGDTGEGSHRRARMVRRIQKLMALAESPEHTEAEAAMRAARRLLLKHNISLAETKNHDQYTWRQVGRSTGRIPTHHQLLAGLLSQHFFVGCVWVQAYNPHTGRRGRVLELTGTLENVEIAQWVHDWLLSTSESLWRDHRKRNNLKGNAARRNFLQGVMMGFGEKLAQETLECEQTGLVWAGATNLLPRIRMKSSCCARPGSCAFAAASTAALPLGSSLPRGPLIHACESYSARISPMTIPIKIGGVPT